MEEETYIIRFIPVENGWIVKPERNIECVPPHVYLHVLQTILAAEQAALREHAEEMRQRHQRN